MIDDRPSLKDRFPGAALRLEAISMGFENKPPELEAVEQVQEAERDLWDDDVSSPRYPYAQLNELIGPLAPGRVTVIAANPGIGKTTLATDLLDRLVSADVGVDMLGLEQRPKELRTRWACLRAGVDSEIAFERSWKYQPNGEALRALVAAEFEAQKEEPLVSRVHFSPVKTVDRAKLEAAAKEAQEYGSQVLIVDHVDRMTHGEGANAYHELQQTMRLATDLADDCALHIVLFSQLNRQASHGDRLARYQPPQLHHLFGGSSKEQEADVVLGLYRPVKPSVGKDEMAAVRAGQAEPQSVLEPNCTAVAVLKHRIRGRVEGRRAFLTYTFGRLTDMAEKDRPVYVTKTNRDIAQPYGGER